MKEPPVGYLDTIKGQTWKPCIACGGEIIQVRKALFTCLKCSIEIIADEEDLKEEKPFKIIKK